jgi:hypothetical protein
MYLARDVKTNINLLVIQKHAVDSLDGVVGSLSGLVMDEAIAFGAALLVCSDLAGQDIAKGSEGVVQSLLSYQSTNTRITHKQKIQRIKHRPCYQSAHPGS